MGVRSRTVSTVAVTLAVLLALGAGFWAGRVTLRRTVVATAVPDAAVVVAVSEQTVGKVLTYNVTASRPKRALASNVLSGVVTRAHSSGRFSSGDVVYRVKNASVRVVEGQTPFFRDLSSGVSGADVKQLKTVLRKLKYLSGSNTKRFDWATNLAVRKWQKKLGMPQTGEVALGELVAVPKLPAKLVIDSKVARVGASLSGGEQIVSWASGAPSFTLGLQAGQGGLGAVGGRWRGDHQKFDWPAVITGTSRNANDEVVMVLASPEGGPVCGKQCDALPAASTSYLLSDVAVVKPATGPAGPVAAVTTQGDSRTTVLVVESTGARVEREVRVKASQDGVAIVDGVKVGERVQVLAGGGGASASAAGAGR